MHPLSFQFKRAHWSSVAFGKWAVRHVAEMTPARFDILYMARTVHSSRGKRDGFRIMLCTIIDGLGLHHSTVGKMIARMRELGWLICYRWERDRRFRIVELTEEGVAIIEKAIRRVFKMRTHLRRFEDHFKRFGVHGFMVLDQVRTTIASVQAVARWLGDRSWLRYTFGWPEPPRRSEEQRMEDRWAEEQRLLEALPPD